MTQALASGRTSIIQNSAAASVFLFLAAAQLLSWLLYLDPGSETLWWLTVNVNRIASPFIYKFDELTGLGPTSIAVLASMALLPLLSHWKRSWLGTASSAHIALGICVLLTAGAIRRDQTGDLSASLSPQFVPSDIGMSSVSLVLISLAMVGLCAINHIVFFARARGRTAS